MQHGNDLFRLAYIVYLLGRLIQMIGCRFQRLKMDFLWHCWQGVGGHSLLI